MHDGSVAIRRFERDDRAGRRRFWEIELHGASLTTRRNRSADGLVDVKRKEFASADKASTEAEIRIRHRLSAGWREVGSPLTNPARNHALEAAIVDDVDDVGAWSVYADWLQARGDRIGEWLALSLAGSLPDANPRELWSIELTRVAEQVDVEAMARLEVRHGFIVQAWVGKPDGDFHARHRERQFGARLLGALLRSAATWLLRSLTVGLSGGSQVDVLLGNPDSITLAHLRELMLGDFVDHRDNELARMTIGDLARVLRACPSLETLHVRGIGIRCDSAIDHAQLTRLTLETVELTGEAVEALARASLPSLCRLTIWLGHGGYAKVTFDHLQALFREDHTMVGLRELALVNCDFADSIAEALAHSTRLARLERVDLSGGTMREHGGRAILDHVEAFRHLRSLDLDGNYLPPEIAGALEVALPGVVRIGTQIDPEIGRGDGTGYYVAVGE